MAVPSMGTKRGEEAAVTRSPGLVTRPVVVGAQRFCLSRGVAAANRIVCFGRPETSQRRGRQRLI